MNKNYVPLYRKYRPQTLEQIVGQDHIKKALTNAILTDRISHAYLFTGPRGTGKTSTARIFAKSLNCIKGMSITPCNECENCKNITNSVPIDVIEIDAASNRSVNDADEIIQKVALAPVQSRYKIYIIDEVHMLTNQAFNALLKTLEEPPQNVIFILATTEVHKVLDTIKSRCQRFDFKRITTDDIAKHLRFIADSENINITDEALFYIAQNSAGGMRDSIALLDQMSILNSADTQISVDDINRLLGRLSFKSLTDLYSAIINSNQTGALEILNEIYNQGNEPIQILSNFLEYLRSALIIKSVSSIDPSAVQLNSEQISQIQKVSENIEAHQIISLTEKCASYIKELKLTSNPKLWLDIAILDMANITQNTKLEDLQKRISTLESGEVVKVVNASPYNTPPAPVIKQEIIKPQPKAQSQPENIKQKSEEEVLTQPVPMSKKSEKDNTGALWQSFLDNISSFPSRAILKQEAKPVKLTKEEIIITIKNPNWLKQFGKDGTKYNFVVSASKALFGDDVGKIVVREPQASDHNIKTENPVVEKQPVTTPIAQDSEEDIKEQLREVNEIIEEDSSEQVNDNAQNLSADNHNHTDEVNMAMELFEGKLID